MAATDLTPAPAGVIFLAELPPAARTAWMLAAERDTAVFT